MNSNKRDANRREHDLAQALGMRKSCNSGAVFNDGDLSDDDFMIDEKFTTKAGSISLKRADLVKLDAQAGDMIPPRIPVLVVNINGFKRAVISMADFNEYRRLTKLHKCGNICV